MISDPQYDATPAHAGVEGQTQRKIAFYPHGYLRDRHLDTIRSWPATDAVLNRELGERRCGNQVSKERSLARHVAAGAWLPVINVKPRPKGLPGDAVVYVCGALMLTGAYIVELDNPYSLTRYNLGALRLYRSVIRHLLLQDRCREIRCISRACRETLGAVLGRAVYDKSRVHYPRLPAIPPPVAPGTSGCRFLFVSTQFEIKAGPTVLRAFREIHARYPDATIDVITHLPDEHRDLAAGCAGIRVHPARYTREEMWSRFMRSADVIVHPTFVESFGMVVLEALAHGLGIIATDVYALREMVEPDRNGFLISPPLSVWDGYLPSREYRELGSIKEKIRSLDDTRLQMDLVTAMTRFAADPEFRRHARAASQRLYAERFATDEL